MEGFENSNQIYNHVEEEDDGEKVIRKNIALPGKDYIVCSWKVKDGSVVQLGETIALAIKKYAASSLSKTVGEGSTAAESTTKFKRPTRRNRKPIAAAAAASASSSASSPPVSDSSSLLPSATDKKEDGLIQKITGMGSSAKKNESTTTQDKDKSTVTTETTKPPPSTTDNHNHHTVPIVSPMDGFLHLNTNNNNSDNNDILIIGYVESCTHPTLIEGLCAVCGKLAIPSALEDDDDLMPQVPMMENDNNRNNRSLHSPESYYGNMTQQHQPLQNQQQRVTVDGGITMTISKKEGERMALQSSAKLRNQKKLALVLDLDHTLVHATADPRASNHLNREDVRSIILPMIDESNVDNITQQQFWMQHYVKLRPHVKEFFISLQPLYEISIYTAGTREYAKQIAVILCRHIVGAKLDQIQLGSLKHRVEQAEAEMEYDKQQTKAKMEYEKQQKDHHNNDGNKKEEEGKEEEGNQEEGNQEEEEKEEEKEKEKEKEKQKAEENEDNSQEEKQEAEENENGNNSQQEKETESIHDEKQMEIVNDYNSNIDRNSNNHSGDNADSQNKNKNKRKRVTFQEPTEQDDDNYNDSNKFQKSSITMEELESLKKELKDAEDLENKALELRQRLFGSRLVSRTDVGDLGRDVKSIKRIFPCGGAMAAVVDDREDVWANAVDNDIEEEGEGEKNGIINNAIKQRKGEPPENVLLVRPYHWQPFLGFADINNTSGIDITVEFNSDGTEKITDPMEENDEQLLWTRDILKRLHERYYNTNTTTNDSIANTNNTIDSKKTVRKILRQMRSEVLGGSNTVLSGLIPLHKQNVELDQSTPRPAVVRYVEWLGSTLQSSVKNDTSYVIAAKDGTDKTLAARKIPNCYVLKVSWLMECLWSLTRRELEPHILTKKNSSQQEYYDNLVYDDNYNPYANDDYLIANENDNDNGEGEGEGEGEGDDDDDDDSDDDFAAELETEFGLQ